MKSYAEKKEDWTDRREQMKIMREKGKTLQEIGDYFNISRERVRQVLDTYYNMRGRALSPTGRKSTRKVLDKK